MALRLRLVLLFAAATAALVAVAGFAFILQLRVRVVASLDPGLRARIAALGDELDPDGALPPLGVADTLVQASAPTGQLLAASPRPGPGLGLAIVRAVAQAHGGTASATNRETGGAAVRIVIPRGVDGPPSYT